MIPGDYTKRLLTYRLSLTYLKETGIEPVYSYLISSETGYSAALIRKDLSRLKVRGNRRGGYKTEAILRAINHYFEHQKNHKTILVGMGNIGQAIARYRHFKEHNIRIAASFDLDPAKQKQKHEIPVYPMEKCAEIISNENINTAIIAVPAYSAQIVCDKLIRFGIRGILNLAPVHLKVPKNVFVSNVRICDELLQVIHHTKELEQQSYENI